MVLMEIVKFHVNFAGSLFLLSPLTLAPETGLNNTLTTPIYGEPLYPSNYRLQTHPSHPHLPSTKPLPLPIVVVIHFLLPDAYRDT